jgi:cell filamentation protein
MIENSDTTILGTTTLKNKLGITDRSHLAKAEADLTAVRLAELQTAPIRGGFDTIHLQNIHHHIYQDLYDWAGEFRRVDSGVVAPSVVEKSLNILFDRLARQNHLKGYSPEDWASSASTYMCDLGTIQPFIAGNGVVAREFATELARKNNLNLQWGASGEIATDEGLMQLQQNQDSAELRRMVMLAMDTDPGSRQPSRGSALERGIERLLSNGNFLL